MARPAKIQEAGAEDAIRAYKTILSQVIDQRPSGMRQRLADALGRAEMADGKDSRQMLRRDGDRIGRAGDLRDETA
ncbi:MAG: hypothetical protein E5X10_19335, partial [Mesorhizobium sp.]